MGTQIKQYETYPLYLILSTITCALLTAVLGFLMYVLEPGLLQLHPIAPVMSSIVLSILIGIIWLLCLSLIVATLGIIRLHPIVLRLANQFIYEHTSFLVDNVASIIIYVLDQPYTYQASQDD